jgi:hypothetical protein
VLREMGEEHFAHRREGDRVRAFTAPGLNRRIDAETEQNLRLFSGAGPEEIGRRIRELDREWDFDRILEFDTAAQGLIGLALAVSRNRKWLLVPGAATGMMLFHALAGPYPFLPLLRLIGFRTRDEIEREKYALKALRGDFEPVRHTTGEDRAAAAWRAVTMPERPAAGGDPLRGEEAVRFHAHGGDAGVGVRIRELEAEWDMERIIQANAGIVAGTGLALGAVDRRWLALPGMVFSWLLMHTVGGLNPPVRMGLRMGVRTRPEINRERYALKALRGDFDQLAAPRADNELPT